MMFCKKSFYQIVILILALSACGNSNAPNNVISSSSIEYGNDATSEIEGDIDTDADAGYMADQSMVNKETLAPSLSEQIQAPETSQSALETEIVTLTLTSYDCDWEPDSWDSSINYKLTNPHDLDILLDEVRVDIGDISSEEFPNHTRFKFKAAANSVEHDCIYIYDFRLSPGTLVSVSGKVKSSGELLGLVDCSFLLAEDGVSFMPIPVFIRDIGKSYPVLVSEHPEAIVGSNNMGIPDAALVCLQVPGYDFAYILFGTQYLAWEHIAESERNN